MTSLVRRQAIADLLRRSAMRTPERLSICAGKPDGPPPSLTPWSADEFAHSTLAAFKAPKRVAIA